MTQLKVEATWASLEARLAFLGLAVMYHGGSRQWYLTPAKFGKQPVRPVIRTFHRLIDVDSFLRAE